MLKATNRLGIIFFPAFDWAISPTHPEREERLLYTQDQLREEGIFDIEGITEYKPDMAGQDDVSRIHFCIPDVPSITTESHLISAGGAIKAARLLMDGAVDKAFALVRPPGHHAMKVVHGSRGFCKINIEAVMIEYIREHYGQKRVAIVDTDCHHGDGTQNIYWNDPNTLFISLHQDGKTLYPGTGFIDENGGPNALNRTINIPLPPGTCDEGFIYVIDNIVLQILADFKPDLIINSAGQDNHYSDPLTNMKFTAQGYALLNQKLNPHIAVLEGGYSIQGALPYINSGIALAMAGVDFSNLREPDYDPVLLRQDNQITEHIKQLSDKITGQYFGPVKSRQYKTGSFVSRNKNIFYDTDMIRERQKESVMVCDDCAGVLLIETASDLHGLSVCVEIPLGACDHCREEGLRIFEEAHQRDGSPPVKLINRRDKVYIP